MVIGPGCADQKKKEITERGRREICTTVTRVHVSYEDLAWIQVRYHVRMLLHVGAAGYA